MKTKRRLFILFISIISGLPLGSTGERHKYRSSKGIQFKAIKPATTDARKNGHGWRSFVRSSRLGAPSRLPGQPEEEGVQADFAHGPDVSVTCSGTEFVVRVRPSFYGLGADAQELTLGSGCRSNGVLRPPGDLLFTFPLTGCGAVRELLPGYLVYKYVLHYEPSLKRFPSRAHEIDVNIECHYPRDHSVHQLAVQPTWPSLVLRKKLQGRSLEIQINLMDDSWKRAAKSPVYLIGQTVNVKVSSPHLPPGLKLYISSCYAAPSSGSKSSLKYTMIGNYGCMLDSKQDLGASRFISRTDGSLRFSLRAFQFAADPDTEVSIHCKVSVTSEGPGPAHKSCTYQTNRWRALTGHDSICECCESTCVTLKSRRALMEGFARSTPMLVSDQLHAAAGSAPAVLPSGVSKGEHENVHKERIGQKKQQEAPGKSNAGDTTPQFEDREIHFGEKVQSDLKEEENQVFWEDGSGYKERDFSEHKETEDEASEEPVIRAHQEEEGSIHLEMTQTLPSEALRESEAPDQGEKTRTCRGKERRPLRRSSPGDQDQKTWVFTWT